jgi:integrase
LPVAFAVRPLISPLVDDLRLWRKASSKATGKALPFPDANGTLWPEQTYANWRQRVFNPVAPDDATPYSCRHGYASLLLREGKPLAEVSRLMGNSPTVTAQHYTHVMERYANQPSQPIEALVLSARSVRKVSDAVIPPLRSVA